MKYTLQIITVIIIFYIQLSYQGIQQVDQIVSQQELLVGGSNIRFNDGASSTVRRATSIIPYDNNIFGLAYYKDHSPHAAFIQGGQIIDDEVQVLSDTDQKGLAACKVNQDQMFVLYSATAGEQLSSKMVTKAGGTVQLEGTAQVIEAGGGIDQRCVQLSTDLIGVVYMNGGDDVGATYQHGWGIYFKTYTISTETYGAKMLINDDVVGFQHGTGLVKLNNNRVIVTFIDLKKVTGLDIDETNFYYQDLDITGAKPGGSINQLIASDTENPPDLSALRVFADDDLYIAWRDNGDVHFRKYNGNTMAQECELNVASGNHPTVAVYQNIAYYRYYDDDYSYVVEIYTNNCTFKAKSRLETTTNYKYQEEFALSVGPQRVTLAYLQSGPSGASTPVKFTEYLIEESTNSCANNQCSGCFGAYLCNVCDGSNNEQKALKKKDSGDCGCIDGYFYNSASSNCEKCHYKCQTCTAYETCVLCSDTVNRIQAQNCICQDGYYDDGVFGNCVSHGRCLVPSDVGYNIQTAAGVPKVAGHLPSTTNNAYQFDGSSHLDLGSQTFGREISISFWAKFDVFNSNSRIYDCGQGHGVNNLIIQNVDATGQIMVEYYRDSQSNKQYSSQNAVLSQWDHWTVTIDDEGDINIYKNGELGNTGESYTSKRFRKEQRDNCFIGKPNNASDSNFQGELEQLRIYYRVLKENEISCLSEKTGYCEHQCGQCAGTTPQTCESCSDTNRDFGSSCQCNTGFTNVGTRATCEEDNKSPKDFILEGRDSQNFGTTDGQGMLPGSNSAMVFNGDGNYRDFGTTNFGGEVTVSAWVKFDRFRQYSRIIDFGNGMSQDNLVFYNELRSRRIYWSVFDGSTGFWQHSDTVNLGEWVHLVATKDASSSQVFRDGVDITSTTVDPQTTVNTIDRTMCWIGRSHWETSPASMDDWFEGKMDHLRIYNRILSNTEIQRLADIQTYCDRKCLNCENTFDECKKCVGTNRDIENNCNCLEGYYDNGTPECQPVFPCYKRMSQQLEVLANDGDSIPGKLFHFNRETVDTILGRLNWNSNMFNVVNLRTGQTKKIILFTNVNGGSQGDASGRLEPEVSTQQEFKVGDIIEFKEAGQCEICAGKYRVLPYCNCVQGYYEVEGQNDCQPNSLNCDLYDTRIKVLSADSSQDSNPGFTTGMHFNFNAQELDRILQNTSWDQDIIKVTNLRTNYRASVKVYRSTTNGGSSGDSYGKIVDDDPLQFTQAFMTNDILDLQTQSACIKCFGINRRLPNCECAYGYIEVNENCQKHLPMGNYCQNFYHLEAQAGTYGYVRVYKNNEYISDLPFTADHNQKGITAVIIDKDDYSFIDKKIYDLKNNAGDEAQFQTDIGALAADTIVLIGISNIDTGSDLSSVGIDTLKTLGANSALTIGTTTSYVLIGKKGAAEGSRSEWYEAEFPQVNSINLFQTSNVQQSFVSGCIDNPYQAITYSTCHTVEELNLFDGVTAFKDQKTLPNLIKYTNIPHIIQDGVFLSGDQVLQSTSDCTITPGLDGDAYIFIENENSPFTTSLKDGDIEHTLIENEWTKLPDHEQTMKQLTVQTNEVKDVTIFRKHFTTDITFPEIKLQEFTGGIAFKIKVCHETCATCTGSGADQCQTCHEDQNREFDSETNSCLCKSNYYDDYVTLGTYICQECNANVLQCPYSQPIFIPIELPKNNHTNHYQGPSFTVQIGNVQVPVDKCSLNRRCTTCDLDSCKTCKGDNRDPALFCLCAKGFYEHPFTRKCEKCNSRCRECHEGPNNCLYCNEQPNRITDAPKCSCQQGYGENSDFKCMKVVRPDLQEQFSYDWLYALFFGLYMIIIIILSLQYYRARLKETNYVKKVFSDKNSKRISEMQELPQQSMQINNNDTIEPNFATNINNHNNSPKDVEQQPEQQEQNKENNNENDNNSKDNTTNFVSSFNNIITNNNGVSQNINIDSSIMQNGQSEEPQFSTRESQIFPTDQRPQLKRKRRQTKNMSRFV